MRNATLPACHGTYLRRRDGFATLAANSLSLGAGWNLVGNSGIADLSLLVSAKDAGIFAPLADPKVFEQAQVELGVITWPIGADLDPDWLHEEISRSGEWHG